MNFWFKKDKQVSEYMFSGHYTSLQYKIPENLLLILTFAHARISSFIPMTPEQKTISHDQLTEFELCVVEWHLGYVSLSRLRGFSLHKCIGKILLNCSVGLRVSVRTLGVTYDHTLFYVGQITKLDIRQLDKKWAISLVIADGHINLPQEFTRVCMGLKRTFTLRVLIKWCKIYMVLKVYITKNMCPVWSKQQIVTYDTLST